MLPISNAYTTCIEHPNMTGQGPYSFSSSSYHLRKIAIVMCTMVLTGKHQRCMTNSYAIFNKGPFSFQYGLNTCQTHDISNLCVRRCYINEKRSLANMHLSVNVHLQKQKLTTVIFTVKWCSVPHYSCYLKLASLPLSRA